MKLFHKILVPPVVWWKGQLSHREYCKISLGESNEPNLRRNSYSNKNSQIFRKLSCPSLVFSEWQKILTSIWTFILWIRSILKCDCTPTFCIRKIHFSMPKHKDLNKKTIENRQQTLNNFFGGISPFLWGHRYPCFGFLVISAIGFKTRVDSSVVYFVAFMQWIPEISLLWHILIPWQPVMQHFIHILAYPDW